MKQKIPFSIMPFDVLKKISRPFSSISRRISKFFPYLREYIKTLDMQVDPVVYINTCLLSTTLFYFFISLIFIVFLFLFDVDNYIGISLVIAIPLSLFVLFRQLTYPKLLSNKRIRNIDRNLLPALQHIMINLNSGIPLFNTLVAISAEDFGEISREFKKVIKRINAGEPQLDVLNDMADKNPSLFFRRAIWQLVNGMKSGADIARVISDIINALSEEQLIQIENYGGKLRSLAMFYMMVAVILPSLGMTFLVVIFSFIGTTSEITTKMIFWSLYAFVIFSQIMFLGMVRAIRPTLLGSENV